MLGAKGEKWARWITLASGLVGKLAGNTYRFVTETKLDEMLNHEPKNPLITGFAGQGDVCFAEFFKKSYFVHGIKCQALPFNTDRIDHLCQSSSDGLDVRNSSRTHNPARHPSITNA